MLNRIILCLKCILYIWYNSFQPTFLHLAPPVVSFLANSEKVKPEHLGSIKSIFVAAAPFGEAVAQKFLEKAPHVVFREGRFEKNYFNIDLY